uniref:UMP-CMP kinase n=1 Tax=Globodera pallida TaxID=36090 RepID=A0A183C0T0_GLOPA
MTADQQQKKKTMFKVVFVLGPPGSGKGTQCQRIEKHFGFVHLSAGDLLREERQREGSAFGELIDQHIREGSIVPVEITCKLLENAMAARSDSVPGFLIDGFPRNRNNLDGWQREMGAKAQVLFVLCIQAPIEICVQRCLGRGQGRTDDNEESMRKRIVTYNDQTVPIIDHYASLDLVKKVDSTRDVDLVFSEVRAVFERAGIVGTNSVNSVYC